MVESTETKSSPKDIISKLIKQKRQMVYTLLMPYLDSLDLVHFYQINSLSKSMLTPSNEKCIHFDVLFKMQKRNVDEEAVMSIKEQERFTDVMKIIYE